MEARYQVQACPRSSFHEARGSAAPRRRDFSDPRMNSWSHRLSNWCTSRPGSWAVG